jgi:hypothetical protein
MGKKKDLIEKLKSLIHNPEQLERFLIDNSNLPGTRANLELIFAFVEIYDDFNLLLHWANISSDQADTNHPKCFLVCCSAACLGKIYSKTGNRKSINILQKLANDERWRAREAVAFGFQIIGENDFKKLKAVFSRWIKESNNLEKRAMLVSLAHPKMLDAEKTNFCFEIAEMVFREMDREKDFEVLRKGLEFTLSVFVAANPQTGFRFLKEWLGRDRIIDKIIAANLKKHRILSKYPDEANHLLELIKYSNN